MKDNQMLISSFFPVFLNTKLNSRFFNTRILFFLFLAASCCLLLSCVPDSTEAETSFKKSDRLTEAIQTFETHRLESQGGLKFAYYQIDSILKNYEVENARPLTLAFEKVWIGVLQQIQELKQKFVTVRTSSNAYFSTLENLTSQLNDESRMQLEAQQNQELRAYWESELKKAESKLAEIDNLLAGGDDLFRILLINSLRATLSEEIKEIQRINLQADQLLLELKKLSQEGLRMLAKA